MPSTSDSTVFVMLVKKHWGLMTMFGTWLLTVAGGLLYAGDEFAQYKDLKDAVASQKQINVQLEKDLTEMKIKQTETNVKTEMILDILKEMNRKMK